MLRPEPHWRLPRLWRRVAQAHRVGVERVGDSGTPAAVLASVAAGALLLATAAVAAPLPPLAGWFIEGAVGTVQPGPDGTDFGAGQSYGAAVGYTFGPRFDGAFVVGLETARKDAEALDTSVSSGGVRGRVWLGAERWSTYLAAGARLYRFSYELRDVGNSIDDRETHVGGDAAAGIRYRRSTWWVGLDAGVHAAIGSGSLEGGDLLTFTTYRIYVGAPTGW